MGYRVVVVGATGNVGREMLNVLAEREFPIEELAAVASARSTGDEGMGVELGQRDTNFAPLVVSDARLAAGPIGPPRIEVPA